MGESLVNTTSSLLFTSSVFRGCWEAWQNKSRIIFFLRCPLSLRLVDQVTMNRTLSYQPIPLHHLRLHDMQGEQGS